MEKDRFRFLLQKRLDNTLSDAEQGELLQLLEASDREMVVKVMAGQIAEEEKSPKYIDDTVMEKSFRTVMESDKIFEEEERSIGTGRVRFLKVSWLRYAAVIILVFGIGTAIFIGNKRNDHTASKHLSPKQPDILPGRQGAVLTLAEGKQLVLDSLEDGIISDQGGAQAVLNNGQLTYNAIGNSYDKIAYNTMSTPKGRQFQFTLPDGTKVWLNAASSIRYPTVFTGKNRKVDVTGEVYFDVYKNAGKPFIVETDKVSIEVLGTEFNINNYDNEAYSQTTLINGLVKLVSKAGQLTSPYKLLYPGKQATILRNHNDADTIKITDAANIDQVTAWKEGLFDFNKVDLFNLMRQLERWYNIQVEYKGEVENIRFRGKMYRSINLSDVLKELRKMDLSIEQEGNKLIVTSIK